MNPYALRTCAVGASCHVLTDLKLNIVEFSVFRYTISWYITNYKFLVHYNYIILWQNPNSPQSSRKAKKRNIKKIKVSNDMKKLAKILTNSEVMMTSFIT